MQALWETLGIPRSRAAGKNNIFNNYYKFWRLFNLCGEQLTSTSPHDRPLLSVAGLWCGWVHMQNVGEPSQFLSLELTRWVWL